MKGTIHDCAVAIKAANQSHLLLRDPKGEYQIIRASELSAQRALDPRSKRYDDVIGVFNPAAIQALLQHIEGLERDARRYRWIRRIQPDAIESKFVGAYLAYDEEDFDAAIDALAEQGETR